MNHVYRLVFNRSLNTWVAVAETAKSRSKGGRCKAIAMALAAVLSAPTFNAYALPTDGQVSAGIGTIAQSGNAMTITQASQNLALNWQSFNIAAPETVNFVQPNSSAIALNRVLGSDPSAIYGKLNANGQVFLLNPNGILFGSGAQVNVGGLVASTLNLSDADFMARNFRFTGTAGSVKNQGSITAVDGGYVALLGGQVSNQGTLVAKLGNVTLAAGSDTTLDFAGDGLIRVTVNQGTLNALAENKQLIQADGGNVLLTAKAADSLISAVVNNEGVIEAHTIAHQGGVIKLMGDNASGIATNSGTLDGNQVDIEARSVLQAGTVRAADTRLSAGYALIQTQAGSVTADTLHLDGGDNAFVSGSLAGQDITVAGQRITLAGATVSTGDHGRIRIGGGAHGADGDIANAQSVSLNGATTLTAGDDAQVVVWSEQTSNYFGSIAAGDNAFVEVSSKGTLNLGGTVRTGANSQVLYDPTDIVIDATAPASFYLDLADPTPTAGDMHGDRNVEELANGNIVVPSTQDDFGGINAGAVYLYNGSTGALISTLTGSHANDRVGSDGIIKLTNGNYVVRSTSWNGQRGAATWGSGTVGISGVISAANSLVGSTANDFMGLGVTALANGNYVAQSYFWNGQRGAATWGSGTAGISGEVSAANSLVGSTANDQVGGGGITALTNGNYVVKSLYWNGYRGAATLGSGTAGISGEVSADNSLVGSSMNDLVGQSVTALTNGNYVVSSPSWNDNRGAATWGSGTTGVIGTVSAANSLVGSSMNDRVGDKITALTNGNYVVSSPYWNGQRGAATWGSGTTGLIGTVSADNSLVGSSMNDRVGMATIGIVLTALTNGNYVVGSPYWNGNRGAATWGNGTTGLIGTVSAANSLIGSENDYVGNSITALTNGNYVVGSPSWNGLRGAATWGSGTTGLIGTVSAANSLVGSTANDQVGNWSVTALTNGNYVVQSLSWNGARGAATWGSGTTGVIGTVSAANSLVGSSMNDRVGDKITALTNGNYVVQSLSWNGARGAATWSDGTTGVKGTVSAANSLVGSTEYDFVGRSITALTNGNYVVGSTFWNGYRGAATWGSGTTGVIGTVSAANSLVGSSGGDYVGDGITALTNGNYVVSSPYWSGSMGAVWLVADPSNLGTLASSSSAASATVSPAALAAAGAGSTITLQASNDITVNSAVNMSGRLQLIAGNAVTLNAGLTSSDTGDALVLSGNSFVNNVGANALSTPNGRWLVYSANPTGNTLGGLVANKHYAATYNSASTPAYAASGNWLLYSVAPVLSVTPGNQTATYGTTTSFTPGYTGFIDGDNAATAGISGTASYSVGGATSGAGHAIVGSHDVAYASGLVSSLGYSFADNTASTDELTVNALSLAVSGLAASHKTYDGSTTATLTGTAAISALSGDTVTLGGTASGAFADKNTGSGKSVTVTGNTISGADAGNYTLVQQSGLIADITPKALSITGSSAADKTYDGTTAASIIAGTLAGFVGSETVTVGASSGSFDTKNVGAGKTVSASHTLADGANGGLASNYSLGGETLSASITPKALSISGSSAADKTYDGTTAASITAGTLAGFVGSETVSIASSSGSFDTKNVGTGKTVSASHTLADGSNGGLASNYVATESLTASINKRGVTVSGITVSDKAYDGTTNATASTGSASIAGLVSGDTVSVSASGSFSDKNAGSNKTVSLTSSYSGSDAGNYNFTDQASTTASITPKVLTITGSSAADKTYDGNTSASITAGTLVGFVGSETVTVGASSGSFATKDVGAGKTVTASHTLADGSNGGLASNYSLGGESLSASITPKALTISGSSAADKVYDGNTSASITAGTLAGFVGSETVGIASSSGSFNDKNAGTDKTVTASHTLADGSNGGLASNYSLGGESLAASINKKGVTVSGITVSDKAYDGTTNATASTGSASIAGLVSGDTVSVSASGSFSDKNAGSNKTVSLTSSYSGSDAGNYNFTDQASTTASITPKVLTITGSSAADKTYDGTTAASITAGTLAGFVGSETVTVGTSSGSFATKDVGAGKTVTASHTLTDGSNGGLASNYSLGGETLNASITPKALIISGSSAANKVYDGNTSASITAGTLAGFVGSETVTVGASSGSFATKDVGAGKTVTASHTLTDGSNGGLASNYSLGGESLSASITPKALSITGSSAADKTYDGTTAASITAGTLAGFVGSESVAIGASSGSFDTKEVGAGKTVTASHTLANGSNGGLASNYSLSGETLSASITPKALSITGSSAADKTYDGTTAASITAGTLAGFVGSETVSVGASSGEFDTKEVGAGKTVTASHTLTDGSNGGLASNYSLANESLTASIKAVPVATSNSVYQTVLAAVQQPVLPPAARPVAPPAAPPTTPASQGGSSASGPDSAGESSQGNSNNPNNLVGPDPGANFLPPAPFKMVGFGMRLPEGVGGGDINTNDD